MNFQEVSKIDISGINIPERRIYLASPYTHEDKEVMTLRYNEALKVAGGLINKGYLVFSPIVHCHPIAEVCILPRDYQFWKDYSTSFLRYWAEATIVLCLPGWACSVGIGVELIITQNAEIPIYYI